MTWTEFIDNFHKKHNFRQYNKTEKKHNEKQKNKQTSKKQKRNNSSGYKMSTRQSKDWLQRYLN